MFESKLNRGKAGGYAPLDSGSKVPLSYLPPIQSTLDTGSFATTSSLQTLIDVTGSFATTSSLQLLIDVTGSFVTTTLFNEYTASVTMSANISTASFATTSSNTFIGNQTIEGSLTITTPSAGIPNSLSNWQGQGGWNQGYYSNVATTGGTGTGLTVDVAAGGGGYINIEAISINTPGSGYTDGDTITIDNENNLPGTFTIGTATGNSWIFDTSGSLTTPGDINVSGSIYADNLTGLISSSAQITEFGFISSSVNNLATTGSNTFVGNQIISGSLTVSGSIRGGGIVTSSNISTIQTITSASYAGITPVSGTLYIIIG